MEEVGKEQYYDKVFESKNIFLTDTGLKFKFRRMPASTIMALAINQSNFTNGEDVEKSTKFYTQCLSQIVYSKDDGITWNNLVDERGELKTPRGLIDYGNVMDLFLLFIQEVLQPVFHASKAFHKDTAE